MRLFAVGYVGLFPSSTPLSHLLVQLWATFFVRSNSSLCSTEVRLPEAVLLVLASLAGHWRLYQATGGSSRPLAALAGHWRL